MNPIFKNKQRDSICDAEKRHDMMIDIILDNGKICEDERVFFENRASQIIKKYDLIEVRFIGLNHMGSYLHWISVKNRYTTNQGVYHLFVNYPSNGSIHWSGVNSALTDLLEDDGIAVVSRHNVSFWRYMIEYYFNYFCFITDYVDENEVGNRQHNNGRADYPEKSYIFWNAKDKKRFDLELEEIGISGDFVSFSIRDSAYTKKLLKGDFRSASREYETGEEIRNTDENLLYDTIEYLRGEHIKAVRMGALVERRLKNVEIVDYASDYRKEELDAYIVSKSKFMLSDPSGITALATLTSVPLAVYNLGDPILKGDMCNLGLYQRDLCILKKYYSIAEQRYLTLTEILRVITHSFNPNATIAASTYTCMQYCKDNGIIIEQNSSTEIKELAKEMLQRQNGNYIESDQDRVRQEKYLQIINEWVGNGFYYVGPKMCNSFLRTNEWLLQ